MHIGLENVDVFFVKKILLSQGNRSRLNEITLEYIDIEREHFLKSIFVIL